MFFSDIDKILDYISIPVRINDFSKTSIFLSDYGSAKYTDVIGILDELEN
ncbi:MAG: hypothetical protein K2X69_03560 [Silvanigrellaceae bacterium]|nr:hypothetical protein [Silvanigrellaceae bacterium]